MNRALRKFLVCWFAHRFPHPASEHREMRLANARVVLYHSRVLFENLLILAVKPVNLDPQAAQRIAVTGFKRSVF
jgi:hypothetical protein